MAYARMSDVTMKLNGPGSATTYTHTHIHTPNAQLLSFKVYGAHVRRTDGVTNAIFV